MSEFDSLKRQAINGVIADATAQMIDTLAMRVETQVPAETAFTRDDVVELLRAMAETIRTDGAR